MTKNSEGQKITTWKDIEEIQKEHPSKGNGGSWIFRGQANYKWGLESSILRLLKETFGEDFKDHEEALRIESLILEAFQTAQPLPSANPREWIVWWAIAQHYGCATRVLDWSGSLPVALYFTVKQDPQDDGAIFVLDTNKLQHPNECFPSDRTDDCWKEQHELLRSKDNPLLHWCRAETKHIRLNIQDGWFTTCTNILLDQGEVIPDKALIKYRICAKDKPELLRECYVRGYGAASLFSDDPAWPGRLQRDLVAMHAKIL